MAELADALDSGSNGRKAVQVQVLLPAPYRVFITNLRVGCGHSISFCLHFASSCMYEQGLYLLFFVMPVTHSEHTLRQHPCGFLPGNCAVLQDSAVPDIPQTCSESLSCCLRFLPVPVTSYTSMRSMSSCNRGCCELIHLHKFPNSGDEFLLSELHFIHFRQAFAVCADLFF